MLKILASWKKHLLQKPLQLAANYGKRLKGFLPGRGLYLLFLALLIGGSFYLVSNNAIFQGSGIRTHILPGSDTQIEQPLPEEPLAGSSTVPPELIGQMGAQAAPATAPARDPIADKDGLPVLAPPLEGEITTGYGFTYMPTFGDYRFHPGVDLEAPAGSEVKAAASGTIKQVEYSDDWHYRLIVDIGSGYQLVYAHLNSIKVAKGDHLETGATLGLLGEPGTAEADMPPRLHLELLKNGKPLDPAPAL